ncbi:MAG TPA: Plug domain-containing protein, partial [Sphingomicrobium sp.]|nr:Plug domain-containing protein [Sphingomicrobium sp.]
MRTGLLLSVALPALVVHAAAAAQSTVPGDRLPAEPTQATRTTTYDAAFFQQYAPRTALDIAQRVPGFTLDLGNTDVRGFAQAAGNVVINGARPSSKADTLETTLGRIPANRVVRVEVGPGDLYGAEYSGKSQVLNVILSAEAGVDGNVTASGRRIYTGKVVPNLSGSALIKRGASSFNLSAGTQRFGQVEEGSDTLFEAGDGEQLEFRRKINRFEDRSPFVSGSWALERASDNAV